jgi:hypothetical protein
VIDAAALLADCKALVRQLVDDLRRLTGSDPETAMVVDAEYAGASAAGRTAHTKAEWVEGLYAQVAVAWVLGCVFVRFCEDNGMVPDPLLTGHGGRREIALDHRTAYVHANPAHDDRHWLREVFGRYRALPATGEIFGDHNPVWLLAPSADGARGLVQAFQAVDPEKGEVRHDFTDAAWDTRFLGDLYQDLSEHAKRTYALLQTPEFVEEFILDRTLEPALATFGLRETTLIDPTCGSGHFLIGAFARLFERWRDEEPGTNPRELVRRSLGAIGGVDLNPFAVATARFRLLVAALSAGGDTRLADAPAYPIHIAVGDSLLHGDPPGRLAGTISDDATAASAHGYATEDIEQARALLSHCWHAVVGNPPYITAKDTALNGLYRQRFTTCHGKYSLGVPFTERFFQLALFDGDAQCAGYVGLITTNSFMKREMGRNLIEEWVPAHDLTHVIDTSGAYIPGHGTPTVILFGRNRRPVGRKVRAVMGIRGEPSRPADPEKGRVWSRIVSLIDQPGSISEFVSVVDLERDRLTKHPWSIGGGGAAELKETLDKAAVRNLGGVADSIGVFGMTNANETMVASKLEHSRAGMPGSLIKRIVIGDSVRDWKLAEAEWSFFPYRDEQLVAIDDVPRAHRRLWPYRTTMWARATFSRLTYREENRPWWEWHQVALHRLRTPLSIVYAEVATHNHFVLDHGGNIFNQTAPLIKLPDTAGEDEHLRLLGLLNSSTACFWLKQVSHNKGSTVDERGARQTTVEWENFYQFNGTKLREFPVPQESPLEQVRRLSVLAQERAHGVADALCTGGAPTREALLEGQRRWEALGAQMVAAQERLDWEVYRLYGLVNEDLTTGDQPEPSLRLGERAFEIVAARRMAAGEEELTWFVRHGSTPITDLPDSWPEPYKRLVERRIELIETNLNIGLIEPSRGTNR